MNVPKSAIFEKPVISTTAYGSRPTEDDEDHHDDKKSNNYNKSTIIRAKKKHLQRIQKPLSRIHKMKPNSRNIGEETHSNEVLDQQPSDHVKNHEELLSLSIAKNEAAPVRVPLQLDSKSSTVPLPLLASSSPFTQENDEQQNKVENDIPRSNQNRLHRLNSLRRRLKSQEKYDVNVHHSFHPSKANHSDSKEVHQNYDDEDGNQNDDVHQINQHYDRNGTGRTSKAIMNPYYNEKNSNEEQKENNSNDIIHEYSDKLTNIRKSPLQKQQHQRSFMTTPSTLLRNVADCMPEVHFIGEISHGRGIQNLLLKESSCTSISCKWKIEWGKSFSLLEGMYEGQTQYAMKCQNETYQSSFWTTAPSYSFRWNHPIDIHFTTASMKGWPRIIVELWELDAYGRTSLIGFGFTHLPCNSGGMYQVNIQCWRPKSQCLIDELRRFFLGSSTALNDESMIFDDAWQSRHKLNTTSIGELDAASYVKLKQVAINVTTLLSDEQNLKLHHFTRFRTKYTAFSAFW